MYYEIEKKISNRSLKADGLLQFDEKRQNSLFYLSQYKNLIKKNFELNKNGDTIKVLHNSSICQDRKGYYFDLKTMNKTLLLYDVVCSSKTLISDKIRYPEWSISKIPFKYKKWNVYKASAKINNRNWIVLFIKDYKEIKNIGPWLFIGLPGMVVSAHDDQNTYFFELKKIEKDTKLHIKKPKFNKTASFQQYADEAVKSNKKRMIRKISEEYKIPEKEVNLSGSPKYETLDFIEK